MNMMHCHIIRQRKMQILRDFFIKNPALNQQREEALAAGVPFEFEVPLDVARELIRAERMLDC
jgi:hypothetical protein